MKTAISVPNDVFERAERLVRTTGRSRSDLYSAALREYVARHSDDEVTETLDQLMVVLGTDAPADTFVKRAATRRLRRVEW